MKTGMVLERLEKTAVIMKTDGSFETVKAKKHWKRGDVIRAREEKKFKTFPIAACIILCLLIGISSRVYFTNAMVISVDNEQSIEFGVNRFGRVISAKSYNEDQETTGLVKYRDCQEVLNDILSQDTKYVLVTIQSDSKKQEEALLSGLGSIKDKEEVNFMVVDQDMVKEAHSHGMTAGVYSKVQELMGLSPEIEIENYSHCSINEINEEIQQCHNGNKDHGHHHTE